MTVGLTVYALLGGSLGAATLFNRQTLFDNYYLSLGLTQEQLIRGKDAGWTCADDDKIAV